jgi:AmiR/NasT family two-component response regulator
VDICPQPLTTRSVPTRILIVEDRRLTAMDLQTMVEGWGYRVVGIADAADRAFHHAARVRPDLVIVDVGLHNDPDGVFTGQTIHSVLHVPVVFVMEHGDPAMKRTGATPSAAVVQKPLHPDALRSALARALCN